jgi:hypothetical protein
MARATPTPGPVHCSGWLSGAAGTLSLIKDFLYRLLNTLYLSNSVLCLEQLISQFGWAPASSGQFTHQTIQRLTEAVRTVGDDIGVRVVPGLSVRHTVSRTR